MKIDTAKGQQIEEYMSKHQRHYHQRDTHQNLPDVTEGYVFDSASGLYKHYPSTSGYPTENKTQHEKKGKWFKAEIRTDWTLLFISVATLIVVVIYTYANWQLWTETRLSRDRIERELAIAELQAVTANHAADTASKSLRFETDQFTIEQRPWLYASFGLTAEPEQGKEAPKIDIWISNTGKTTALKVIPFYETFTATGEPPNPDFSKVKPVSRGILPPSINLAVIGTEPIKSVMLDNPITGFPGYISGKSSIYIRGRIDYRDNLKNKYWTSFCAFHTHGTPLNFFSFFEHGNEVGP